MTSLLKAFFKPPPLTVFSFLSTFYWLIVKHLQPDIKYFTFVSFIVVLILGLGAVFHTLSACTCSLLCVVLIRAFCSPRSSPLWRIQNVFMCKCFPVLLFLFLLILLFLISSRNMNVSVWCYWSFSIYIFFHTDCVHPCMYSIYQSIHHIDPIYVV